MAAAAAGSPSPSASLLDSCLINGRIERAEPIRRLLLSPQADLPLLERLLSLASASQHNLHSLAANAGLISSVLAELGRYEPPLRAKLLQLMLLAGRQRWTVADTRGALALLRRNERIEGEGALAAATYNLEVLELLCQVVAGAPSATTPSAFWDMGAGVLGNQGFDLPAEKLVPLAARGALTWALWVQLDALSGLTTLLSLFDANGCGLQLQLHRVRRSCHPVAAAARASLAAPASPAPVGPALTLRPVLVCFVRSCC